MKFHKWALCVAIVCAAASASAEERADDISPLNLPASGIERTYACRSYLNAFSAMMRAKNPNDRTGLTLLGLYLSMSKTVRDEATSQGIPNDVADKRMTAWDAAVVNATLTDLKGNEDRFGSNLRECVDVAVAAGKKSSAAPSR